MDSYTNLFINLIINCIAISSLFVSINYMQQKISPIPLLTISFAIIVALLVSVMLVSLIQLSNIKSKLEYVVVENSGKSELLKEMRTVARERLLYLHEMNLADDPFVQDEKFMLLREQGEKFIKAREKLASMGLDSISSQLLDRFWEHATIAGRLQYEVIELIQDDNREEANRILRDELVSAQNNAFTNLDALSELLNNKKRAILDNAEISIQKTDKYILIMSISAILAVIAIGGFVIIRMKNSIELIKQSVNDVNKLNVKLQSEIVDRKKYESELLKSETFEKIVRDNVPDSIITINDKGIIISCNISTSDMFGYEKEELIGKNVGLLMPASDIEIHNSYLDNYFETKTPKLIGSGREIVGQRKDHSLISLEIGISEINLDGEHLFVGILHDITEQKRVKVELIKARVDLEKRVGDRTRELKLLNNALNDEIMERERIQDELQHKATHDSLTGLANRALFYEQLNLVIEQAKRRSYKVAIFYLDLDGFKSVNDELGHNVGDCLLIEVGNRLKKVVRSEDIVARMGGDEFVLLLSHIDDEKHIKTIADKVINSISVPFNVENSPITIGTVGASIGISIYPFDGSSEDDLVINADQAMYQAKQGGKGKYVFFQELKRNASGS